MGTWAALSFLVQKTKHLFGVRAALCPVLGGQEDFVQGWPLAYSQVTLVREEWKIASTEALSLTNMGLKGSVWLELGDRGTDPAVWEKVGEWVGVWGARGERGR